VLLALQQIDQINRGVEAHTLVVQDHSGHGQILTSMADPLRFPSDEIVDLYSQRWETELGGREMKQTSPPCLRQRDEF